MGTELALTPEGIGQLILGTVVFLLPGLALADRIFSRPQDLVFAPVLSFTVLSVSAVALNFIAGARVTTGTTVALAIGITLWAGWARLRILFTARPNAQ